MSEQRIKIWDVWVRLFHWSLAVSVIFMLISGETGFQFFDWHKTVGEIILALLVFRLLWGVFGSSNARLVSLFQHPKKGFEHLVGLTKRQLHPERGHNAAGGWAALIMLASVLIQALTGLFIADEDEFIEGLLYGSLTEDMSYFLLRIHYINADLLTIFVIVHVIMILIYWVYARTNLIAPMITGYMRWNSDKQPPLLFVQNSWIGLGIAVCILFLAYLIIN